MRIFNHNESWTAKVNFVDDNNVVLGFDTVQCCCEHAGWFITDEPKRRVYDDRYGNEKYTDHPDGDIDMPGWNFDPSYFERIDDNEQFDDGGMVVFRIVNGDEQKFVHLFNAHNGYYSHGFDFSVNGTKAQDGSV